jgi:hypothetical protein
VSKRLVSLAFVLGLAVIAAGCGGGGSSGWSSSAVAKVEGELADKITESGITPTKDETSCIVKGLEPIVSESEALSNKTPTSQQGQEVEEITTGCLSEATATGSTEDPLGGEEEIRSEAEGEESENQGLQEMNEELQQEYEEEGQTP